MCIQIKFFKHFTESGRFQQYYWFHCAKNEGCYIYWRMLYLLKKSLMENFIFCAVFHASMIQQIVENNNNVQKYFEVLCEIGTSCANISNKTYKWLLRLAQHVSKIQVYLLCLRELGVSNILGVFPYLFWWGQGYHTFIIRPKSHSGMIAVPSVVAP